MAKKIDWARRQTVSPQVEEDNFVPHMNFPLVMEVISQDILGCAEASDNIVGARGQACVRISGDYINLEVSPNHLAHASCQQVVIF